MAMTETERCDFLWKVLDRSDRAVSLADAKAGGVLGLWTAMVAAIVVNRAAILGIYNQSSRPWAFWLVGAALVAVLASILLAFRPRLVRGRGTSLIFFGDLARVPLADQAQYLGRVQGLDWPAVMADLVRQVLANSRIAAVKHRLVQTAILALILALLLSVLCG